MQNTLQDILNLLISPQGNLVFHLTLAFSIIASLQGALIARRSAPFSHANRLALGLGMLLLGQLVLFSSSGLAWQNILNERALIPPLDRAIMLFSVVWIIWLWCFPVPARLGDIVTGFLNLGVVIFFLLTYSTWSLESSSSFFNKSWMDQVWELSTVILVLTGMAVLLFTRPTGWGFGMGMLALILAGTASHIQWATTDHNLSPYLRLGQLAAFPMLPTLMNRFSHLTAAAPAAPRPESQPQIPFPRKQERRRYSSDPRTVQAWLALSEIKEPEKAYPAVAKAVAHTMLSDLCFIISGEAYGHVVLQAGYDLIREEEIKGNMFEKKKVPQLSSALQRGKPLRLGENDPKPADFAALSAAFGLEGIGSLLFIPLFTNESRQGGLLLLSPYSNRQWSVDDQGYLAAAIETIARILNRGPQPQTAAQVGAEIDSELEILRQENRVLLEEISELRAGSAINRRGIPETDFNALVALQQETQEQITQLQSENERLQGALRDGGMNAAPTGDLIRLESELRTTLQEVALLQNHLAETNARNLILEHEARQIDASPNEDREVIVSIVQEIRQPMSSILGYTDLLLAESVGILGALQRKFLERIRASTDRMRTILDDLLRVTAMNEGPVELLPEPIDLGTIIDSAVADTSAQLREKNIALRVDLPQDLPQILADRDAIQQIILHLLQNAGAATPLESTITLRTRVQKDNDEDYLLLQVTDTGGGVQAEDLPNVFSRRHRADMPLIQGLGDTGVGLSIAKILVEAHSGRIWVESIAGQSTTFSVLLPLHPNPNGTKVE